MTVKELKMILDTFPDDMLVITEFHSDFTSMGAPQKMEVLHNPSNDYFASYYEYQHKERPANLITVCYF